jgi:hypothetical protein
MRHRFRSSPSLILARHGYKTENAGRVVGNAGDHPAIVCPNRPGDPCSSGSCGAMSRSNVSSPSASHAFVLQAPCERPALLPVKFAYRAIHLHGSGLLQVEQSTGTTPGVRHRPSWASYSRAEQRSIRGY